MFLELSFSMFTFSGDTRNGQNNIGNLAKEAYMRFTAVTGTIVFDSCNSRYDTYLHVYDITLQREITHCDDCGNH